MFILIVSWPLFFPLMYWLYIVPKPWQHTGSSLGNWYKAAPKHSNQNRRWEIQIMSILQELGLLLSSKIGARRLCTFWHYFRTQPRHLSYRSQVSMSRKLKQVSLNICRLDRLGLGFVMYLPWSLDLGKELLADSSSRHIYHWIKPYSNYRLRPALKPTIW